ncbi:MAG: ornithine cyclodeaminase family protein [Candidatus Acidiferrales bacterium]
MPLLLTECEVKSLLTMPLALECVEQSFVRLADRTAENRSRTRLHAGKTFLHYMGAADTTGGYMGLKIYTSVNRVLRFLIPLFRIETGELVALIEADYVGQMRTGAASGIATKYLSRENSKIVGIIGTGLQSRTQLEATASVRRIESTRAYGRDPERRERFAREMSDRLKIPVTAAASAEQAVRGADIVITSTTSSAPVLEGRWLEPGMHINAIGANFPQKRELDAEAIRRCNLITADSREQSKLESGDLLQMYADDARRWMEVQEIADVVSGKVPGRKSPADITLFKSNGIAVEDVVTAGRIYQLASQTGIGREVPMWQESTS